MRIVENATTYHCSYCSEYYNRKHNCANHERWCRHNPNNKHKCFEMCEHLTMDMHPTGKDFTCSAQCNKPLFSYKAERHNVKASKNNGRQIDLTEAERMPLECPLYQMKPYPTIEFND